MPRLPFRRRGLALALLLAALWVPWAGAIAAAHPCCPGMAGPSDPGAASPCHDTAPAPAHCASLGAAPCCDVAPASTWPSAQRECSQPTPAPIARALHVAPSPSLLALAGPAPRTSGRSPAQRSVVLRN